MKGSLVSFHRNPLHDGKAINFLENSKRRKTLINETMSEQIEFEGEN